MTTPMPMGPLRWKRLRALLDLALDLNDSDCDLFVASLSHEDADLRTDLVRLLAQHAHNEQHRSLDPIELVAPLIIDKHADVGAAENARVGQHVGVFKLLRLIGTGGMGAVYLAERNLENFVHRVALKIVRVDGLSSAARSRFERERQILANLVHAHIGVLFEGGQTDDGEPYYTMEYVDGIAITDYCRDHELDVSQRVRLLIDVAAALAYAHQNLVVHRDIKPSNILVTNDGRAKLLDFGIAKLMGDADAAATQLAIGPMTPEYAAPEQFRNGAVTVATDIYQLGVLCFRLLTGSLPYRADRHDNLAWAQAVTADEPTLLSRALGDATTILAWKDPINVPRVKRQVRGDLDAIVRKALAKEPQERYRSMDALISDLEAFLDGRTVTARRAGSLYFMRRFAARKPWTVAAASVVVLALIAATGISVRAAQHARSQAHRAEITNRFLLTTLDLTDRFSGNNRGDFTLTDVIERAVAQAHTELRDEPEVRATVLTQLSQALQHSGKIAATLTAARESYQIRASARDANAPELAASSQQLASVEIESGYLDDATRHLEETLQQLARSDHQEHALIQAYTSLGKLASVRGDAAASLRWYQQVIPLRQALAGDHVLDLAMDYNNLGTGLINLSRYREADAAYLQGISLLREQLGPRHPRIAYILNGRASALIQLGRFEEADALLIECDALLSANNNVANSAPALVNTLRTRAHLEYFRSDYASALPRLDAALAKTQSASPVSIFGSLTLRGRIELATGNVNTAIKNFGEAEHLLADNGRAEHQQRWYAHGLCGVALASAGDTRQGDTTLDEALVKLEQVGANTSYELTDLLLYAGAAARRRGDLTTALLQHRHAAKLQEQIGWLGELGIAHVDAELAQDGFSAAADTDARASAAELSAHSIAIMQRISPHDPRLAALLTLRDATDRK